MDVLAFYEAGIKNAITLPDGAPKRAKFDQADKRFMALVNCEWIQDAEKIIIATDADEAGRALALELVHRFGKDRCWRIKWPESDEKDANELLINKAEDYKNHCLDQLETNDAEIESFIKIPAYELKNINAEASKRIITDLYQKSMDTVSEADYMEIIAEPMISEKTESKRTFLLTILVMACLFTVLLGTKIIFRLSDEFTL